ncbi:unnamed protein product [Tilletia caries]|nr:unnamed protein product [Tilletia caries]CAD6968985.1 unnamed protein product [Tilletia controversa]CAD7060661.1 unnamed protein product [Tilletia caries]
MAAGTNRMIADSVEYTIASLGHLLMLLLLATEKVLIYIVDTYRSLLQCLIELLIRGVLAILVQVVAILSDGINAASQGIKSAVEASVSGVNTAISTSLAGVNDVLHVIGKSVNVPQIDVPSLDALDNVRLPTFFEDGLIALNNTIPTLDQIKDKMNAVIALPLETLRTNVNNTVNAFTFDRSVLQVPPLPSTALQVCNSTTIAAATTPLDELAHAVHKMEIFLLVGLLIAMLLVALCTVGLEWWAWRTMWRHIRLIRDVCGRREGDSPSSIDPTQEGSATTGNAGDAKRTEAEAESKANDNGDRDPEDHQRALESYRSRTQDPTSSNWANPADSPEPARSSDNLRQEADGGSDHQSISFHAPHAQTRAQGQENASHDTQSPSTRIVVMSDHRIELPAEADVALDDRSHHPYADPLGSDRGTLDLVHLVHYPLSSSLSLRLASILRIRRAQTLDALRWYLGGWLGHAGMLALLAFAIFGAVSSEVHILALERLSNEYDHRLAGTLNDFEVGIRDQLQASFLGQSIAYANQVNNQINTYENNINKDVFGWVDVTTTTMNQTLNQFVDLVEEAISDIFNNTILYSPVQNFLDCILIRKVEGIETALTWIHDNAHVSLARVNQDALTLDDGGMNDLLNPISNLGRGVGNPGSSGASEPTVRRIVQGQLDSLRNQRNFFLIMLAVWAALALLGLAWMIGRMRKGRGVGGGRLTRHPVETTATTAYTSRSEKDASGRYGYEMDEIVLGNDSQPQRSAWRD